MRGPRSGPEELPVGGSGESGQWAREQTGSSQRSGGKLRNLGPQGHRIKKQGWGEPWEAASEHLERKSGQSGPDQQF